MSHVLLNLFNSSVNSFELQLSAQSSVGYNPSHHSGSWHMLHTVLHLSNYPSETKIIPSFTEHHTFCKVNECTVFTFSIHGQSFFECQTISASFTEVHILLFLSCVVPCICGPNPFIFVVSKG